LCGKETAWGCQGFFIFSRAIHKAEKQGSTAALERLEIDRFIVRGVILPTAIEDANPFEKHEVGGREEAE
jgi:hypothetical protein